MNCITFLIEEFTLHTKGRGFCRHSFQINYTILSAVQFFNPLNLTKRAPLYNIFIRGVLKIVFDILFTHIALFKLVHNFDLQWLMICFTTKTLDQNPEHLPEHPELNESYNKSRLRHEEGHVCNLLLFVVSMII